MKEHFDRLMAFLNRDIRTFFPSRVDDKQSKPIVDQDQPITQQPIDNSNAEQEPESIPTNPLPLLLNPAALDRVVFRREILDWRDNSIVRIGVAANAVFNEYSVHIITLLAAAPIWRRPFAKAANEVLTFDFHTRVRLRIQVEAQKYDRQLGEIMRHRGRDKVSIARFIDEWPDTQLMCVAKFRFKPSNQKNILETISCLVLGPNGYTDKLYQQISKIGARITKEV